MTEFRQKLIDRITRIFGLEHGNTIAFIYLCEKVENTESNDMKLQKIVEEWEQDPDKWYRKKNLKNLKKSIDKIN